MKSVFVLAFALLSFNLNAQIKPKPKTPAKKTVAKPVVKKTLVKKPATKPVVSKEKRFEIETPFGKMTGVLSDSTPLHRDNFIKLVNEGFYDSLLFHRVIQGFMIQGGDPLGDGTGGSDTKIKGEFSDNGVSNKLTHKRGAISMARSSSNNSASSQFFIVHKDSRYLDGKYACFGYVTDGMDVVDKICQNVKPVDDNGKVNKGDQPVIEKITVVD